MYRLQFQSGRNKGKRLVVRQERLTIGAAPSCALHFPDDPTLAPEHLRLEEENNRVRIHLLSPDAPLLLNGAPPEDGTPLRHGDLLTIGNTQLLFQDIIPPRSGRFRTSGGVLQPVTWLAAVGVILIELALLVFLVDWQKYIIQPDMEAIDVAYAERMRAIQSAAAATNPVPDAKTDVVALPTASVISAPSPSNAPASEALAAVPPIPSSSAPALPASSDPATSPSASNAIPEDILEALREADFTPADTNSLMDGLPPLQLEDPVTENARSLLTEATAAAQFADYPKAFRLLNQIHDTAPDFLPAHEEHARLLESRGEMEAAAQRWKTLLTLAPARSPERARALAAAARLRARQTTLRNIRKTPADATLSRRVQIVAPSIRKMPTDSDVDEMRILRATLEPAPDAPASLRSESLDVFITFYDESPSGDLSPTRALTTPSPQHLDHPFAARDLLAIDATYIIPAGWSAIDADGSSAHHSLFYGYTIHIFSGDELIDALAKPQKLLDLPVHIPDNGRRREASGGQDFPR